MPWEGCMITRTGVLLGLAVGAWAAGGVVAVHEHWHPFSERHSHGKIAFRKVASGRTVVVSGRSLVRLTEAERAMLPRGYPVESAEAALSRALAWELNERTAAHAVRDPASQAV